jgi:hypothetical protein
MELVIIKNSITPLVQHDSLRLLPATAPKVQDQVRREYRRMALELTEQSPGSRGFVRGTRASPAEFSTPKVPRLRCEFGHGLLIRRAWEISVF